MSEIIFWFVYFKILVVYFENVKIKKNPIVLRIIKINYDQRQF
jgi:hypothetical protein